MASRLDARLAGDLWFFRATVEAGGFSRAGERLAVTQSAVTQRIQRLEERLGCTLLLRGGRTLQLTTAGQQLYQATQSFDAIDEVLRRLGGGEDRRTLRISCIPSLASEWLVPRLQKFSGKNQGIDVAVFAEFDDVDISQMDREDIDVAIRYGPDSVRGVPVVYDHVERVHPVCSAAYRSKLECCGPKDPVVLLHDAIPWPGSSQPTVEWLYWLNARGAPFGRPMQNSFFNLAELALRASVSGAGVALGRSLLTSSYLADGRLVRLCDEEPLSDFRYYVYARGNPMSRDVQAFVEWISIQMNDASAEKPGWVE